jgi:DNA-binding transcriptional LysR family regulator
LFDTLTDETQAVLVQKKSLRHPLDEKSLFYYAIALMQMETLRMFLDVAETQSFTDAARRHHCTPANASHQFHAMEKALGTLLAVPGLHKLQLNQAGHVSHDYCRQMVGLADEMEVQIARVKASGIETLHVAACPSIGLHRLPPMLDRLKTALPRVEVRVGYDTMARVHQAVLRNEVDLGLLPCPRHLPGLAIEIIREVPFMLVCLPEHPFAKLPVVTLAQLPGQPLIVWTQLPWLPLIKALPKRHRYRPRHRFNAIEPLKQALKVEDGVAILPERLVRDEVARGELAVVPFENGRHTVPVAAIYRRHRQLPPALRQFIDFLKQPEPGVSIV